MTSDKSAGGKNTGGDKERRRLKKKQTDKAASAAGGSKGSRATGKGEGSHSASSSRKLKVQLKSGRCCKSSVLEVDIFTSIYILLTVSLPERVWKEIQQC